jgi:hypothetical protein
MNIFKSCLLVAVCACAITNAQAQLPTADSTTGGGMPSEAPMRMSNVATSNTGTIIKKELRWNSKIPLNKTYSQLTPEQKAEVHAMYEALAPGDEPPFPAEGLRSIFGAVRKAQDMLEARGELNLAVTVGPDGKATKVEDYGNVNKREMTQFAAQVLLMTKYKPAVCNGKPCIGQFPFNIKLVSR